VTPLSEERSDMLKDSSDPLLFFCLANKDAASRQIISNCLVLALVKKQ